LRAPGFEPGWSAIPPRRLCWQDCVRSERLELSVAVRPRGSEPRVSAVPPRAHANSAWGAGRPCQPRTIAGGFGNPLRVPKKIVCLGRFELPVGNCPRQRLRLACLPFHHRHVEPPRGREPRSPAYRAGVSPSTPWRRLPSAGLEPAAPRLGGAGQIQFWSRTHVLTGRLELPTVRS
jgi:hypothetical protein